MFDETVILAFSFSSFIFAYLSMKIDKKHSFLQLLFMGCCLFLMLTAISFSMSNEELYFELLNQTEFNGTSTNVRTNINAGYTVVLWAMVITLTYLVINFLSQTLKMLTELKKKK